jgi:hypothetical protein
LTDIVHVQWADAAGLTEWHGKAEFERFCSDDTQLVDSIGIKGFEDDRKIVLIQSTSVNQVTGLFEIPKGCIQSIRVIGSLPITIDLK